MSWNTLSDVLLDRLSPALEPIYSRTTGGLSGVEVLARLNDPVMGYSQDAGWLNDLSIHTRWALESRMLTIGGNLEVPCPIHLNLDARMLSMGYDILNITVLDPAKSGVDIYIELSNYERLIPDELDVLRIMHKKGYRFVLSGEFIEDHIRRLCDSLAISGIKINAAQLKHRDSICVLQKQYGLICYIQSVDTLDLPACVSHVQSHLISGPIILDTDNDDVDIDLPGFIDLANGVMGPSSIN